MSDAASIHLAMLDAVKARDFESFQALFHPDYTYLDGSRLEQGVDACVEIARAYTSAFPDLAVEVRHHHTSGDNVSIIELTIRGTHQNGLRGIPPTGKPIEVIVCAVIETRDGLVYREREYYDSLDMMKQLGVVPDS